MVMPEIAFQNHSDRGWESVEIKKLANVGWGETVLAEGLEGASAVAFGETAAEVVADETVVAVERDGQFEECLEETVEVSAGEEVIAAGDDGDVLGGVVDDDGEVIGSADVLAGEDGVAEEGGVGGLGAEVEIGPCEGTGEGDGAGGVEAEGEGFAGGDEVIALHGGERAAGALVERAVGALGGVDGEEILTGAEAGVEEAEVVESCQGVGVGWHALALEPDWGGV
jgi:hypothetical protein